MASYGIGCASKVVFGESLVHDSYLRGAAELLFNLANTFAIGFTIPVDRLDDTLWHHRTFVRQSKIPAGNKGYTQGFKIARAYCVYPRIHIFAVFGR